jgi:hypothetical protein
MPPPHPASQRGSERTLFGPGAGVKSFQALTALAAAPRPRAAKRGGGGATAGAAAAVVATAGREEGDAAHVRVAELAAAPFTLQVRVGPQTQPPAWVQLLLLRPAAYPSQPTSCFPTPFPLLHTAG